MARIVRKIPWPVNVILSTGCCAMHIVGATLFWSSGGCIRHSVVLEEVAEMVYNN